VASLRFSPETLRGIRNFGADLASPSARAGGMLTGAPQQSLPNIFARNVGTLLGRDMRTPQEKQRQALQSLDPNDPASMEALIKALSITDPERAIKLADAFRQRQKERARVETERTDKETQLQGQNLIFDTLFNAEDPSSEATRSKVTQIRQEYNVSAIDTGNVYTKVTKAREGKTALSNNYTEGDSYNLMDDNGDIFNVQIMNPKKEGQDSKEIITHISGPNPDSEKPFGETTLVSNQGLSPEQAVNLKIKQKGKEKEAELWAAQQNEATNAVEANLDALDTTNRMIDLLTVGVESTGGIAEQARRSIASKLGITTEELTTKEMLVNMAGRNVLDKIKLLGANPSNAEREFLEQLEIDIMNNPKAVNLGILNEAKRVLENQLRRNRYKMTSTREEYNMALQEGGVLDFSFVDPYKRKEGTTVQSYEAWSAAKENEGMQTSDKKMTRRGLR
tara:strand:+ start:51 stop:1403 length:1353 start_codon:yes stop_codon:yes gene_type:complete